MNHKAKLITSIISVVLIAILLAFGIIIALLAYKYTWNSVIDLTYAPNDVSLTFEANINNNQYFVSEATNGVFDNQIWEIPNEETTFTKENRNVVLNFKFINKSNSKLEVNLSGIIKDSKQRFTTTALNSSGTELILTEQPNGTMSLPSLEIEGGVGNTLEFSLKYTLVKTNMAILGNAEDTQHLSINIQLG